MLGAMKLLSVAELSDAAPETWVHEPELVLTEGGKPVAVVTAVDERSVEETLEAIRRARGLAALAAIQRRSKELGLDRLSDEEIEAEIAAVRAERAQRRAE